MLITGNKVLGGVVFLGLLAGVLSGAFYGLVYDLPEINHLKLFKPAAATTVYSADKEVITRFYLEKRFPVSINAIPQHLIDALLVTEDRNFFNHSGVNLKAIVRAIVQDIKAGRLKQGGSTLTQQLAKTLFLSPEKSIVRKIREALLAIQIERRYTKDEILELYLNLIYLGSGAYGVEAAARTYFNTSVAGLTLGQAALIAGLPKAPSVYSPLNNPDFAKKRRAIVLNQMLTTGRISRDEHDAAASEPVAVLSKTETGERADGRMTAPFFVAYLKQLLGDKTDIGYAGGLSIYTTLDLKLQRVAEQSVNRHLAALEKRMRRHNIPDPVPEAALIALDVHTGAIRSMVGGRNFKANEFNRAVHAMRQPGSAFKPFVYAAAVEQGYEQNRTLADAPLQYIRPGNKTWEVKNFSRTFGGEMTLRKALALSKNTPVVRLMETLGIDTVVKFAQKAGIKAPLNPYLSLALGTGEMTLIELTSAYTPFANSGIRALPHAIDRILDSDGREIFRQAVKKESVTDRTTAAIMADMLKAVIYEGTGKRAGHIKKDIAGKTGTTDSYKDALFIGFSPDMACGVWVGNDDATRLGSYETGAKAALPIWTDYMNAFLADRPFQYFDIPDKTEMIYIHPDTGRQVPGPEAGAVRALIRKPGEE
ncbi:MAG: PBP1A family penicillin-binding protein [Desulfobacterales bacterium]|nr:PBP1A family penicillin-binding protein [Desulfobacterales bacterium]